MSPIGRALLSACDENLVIDIDQVAIQFPGVSRQRIKTVTLLPELKIKGGS